MDIEFQHVSYTYQPNTPFEFQALKDISLSIESGSYAAIIGHTGSGKSTLIQHLNGLLQPTEGEVAIGPHRLKADEKAKTLRELRKQVGIVFQYPEHQLFEETVEKDIAFAPKNFGLSDAEVKRRTKQAIEAVQLSEDVLQRSPFELSGGQMRRAAIAGVLAMKPQVLVLDEPTAGLDPKGQSDMMDMFARLHRNQGMTTILVTHSMEDALAYAEHLFILNEGEKYMEGKPEHLFLDKNALADVNLDLPEMISFLKRLETYTGHAIPYRNQSVTELAKDVAEIVKKGARS
ncbi:energy-coupling factor ABC transporter ATP-binding protein [Thalassobacillus sp. CUG 92003]|uniref:energy-coupling factor ABC transporter ATP-binding protein n=1 Tax=Thalassobacillus sp. CUG 92003 TaxID=2736641 RepID=UPI0015E6EF87|nr:energy-coupling factor ABC transporter ATP-binding protein [Thalassobacillus sp. CUG 92003]